MTADLIIVTGCYGSGKTEYAVNMAVERHAGGKACTLVDLDVVNPYFRSRDVRELFAGMGIEVVAPEGAFSHADLPMLSPRIKGAVKRTDRTVILDVGGDPMGARVLGRFAAEISKRPYHMALIVNTRRPESETVDQILTMAENIQRASQLSLTELVANSHLMDLTDTDIVAEGVDAARKAAKRMGLEFTTACVLEDVRGQVDASRIDAQLIVLKKYMKKPWEPGSCTALKC